MIQNIANNILQVGGDSKAINQYFGPSDAFKGSAAGHGSGILRGKPLGGLAIAEERSDSQRKSGSQSKQTGEENFLDDLCNDDEPASDSRLDMIKERMVEESPLLLPAR